ncbi:hypothetical protein SAMN02745857_03444 [Andreprevotia lacus DSM 23236]|jgi:hypothetical protein|uniref:Uncharacterized protein n=2 Tax=Andreprevotia TaxID=397275 RepID=A0A1W1XY51_9NEIS|nr:hypothetical protein SAMN02745857_03444 [Andreprevotia lacus DSM 23236]
MNTPQARTKAALFHDVHTGKLLRQRALIRLSAHTKEDLLLAAQQALHTAGHWQDDVAIPIRPRTLGPHQGRVLTLIGSQVSPRVWFADGQHWMAALQTLYFFTDSYERAHYLRPLLPAFANRDAFSHWLQHFSSRPFEAATIALILSRTSSMTRQLSALLAVEMDREAWIQGVSTVPLALAAQLMGRFDFQAPHEIPSN